MNVFYFVSVYVFVGLLVILCVAALWKLLDITNDMLKKKFQIIDEKSPVLSVIIVFTLLCSVFVGIGWVVDHV